MWTATRRLKCSQLTVSDVCTNCTPLEKAATGGTCSTPLESGRRWADTGTDRCALTLLECVDVDVVPASTTMCCCHAAQTVLLHLLPITAAGTEALQLLHLTDHLDQLQRDDCLDILFAVGLVSTPAAVLCDCALHLSCWCSSCYASIHCTGTVKVSACNKHVLKHP